MHILESISAPSDLCMHMYEYMYRQVQVLVQGTCSLYVFVHTQVSRHHVAPIQDPGSTTVDTEKIA